MTPRKRKPEGDGAVKPTAASSRVTRSSTRRANGSEPPAKPAVQSPKPKRAKTGAKKGGKAKESAKTEEDVEEEPSAKVVDGSKTIVIEHCKQCNQFKIRAIQVKNGLEKGLPGITVLVNPEKPRRGCFEIREEGGETFISLLDMKRPFKPMKDLEMEQVISDIIGKIN